MKRYIPLWKWLLILISAFVLSAIGYGLLGALLNLCDYPVLNFAATVLLLILYFYGVRFFEKENAKDLKIKKLVPDILLGILVGCLFFGLVVGIMWSTGFCKISSVPYNWQQQLSAIIIFFGVAVGEEIIFRGVVFRMIDERWNTIVALVFSALLFGFMHIINEGATWWSSFAIAIEAGLLLGAAYKYSGTLWLPIGIHWAWNYVEGNVFGFAVSGGNEGNSIFKTTVNGPELITGGSFGPEGSVIAVVVGIIFSATFLYLHYNKKKERRYRY